METWSYLAAPLTGVVLGALLVGFVSGIWLGSFAVSASRNKLSDIRTLHILMLESRNRDLQEVNDRLLKNFHP